MRNGKTNAENYREIGVNTFLGLWEWPDERGMGTGFNLLAAQALKDNNMRAYAGKDLFAVQWLNDHPEFADTFIGYILGDEPDMNKVNGREEHQPAGWKENGDALRKADPWRELYATFGKGFACDPWNGYHATDTQTNDFLQYVSPLTSLAADYYGLTDPYELPADHGIWTYGRAVANVKKYSGSRPVWGVVEASCPWTPDQLNGNSASNRMYDRMQPDLLAPAVWNMIVHGATGIIYFCHDFSRGQNPDGSFTTGLIEDGVFAEPGMPDAMKALHEKINQYGQVLMSPDIQGATQVNDGEVSVTLLTKIHNGNRFIFAMGDGNAGYREGQTVNATIEIAEAPSGSVNVIVDGENRSLVMINGVFEDVFDPYELHVYIIGQ